MTPHTLTRPNNKQRTPFHGKLTQLITFETTLGWFGISHAGHLITEVKFGYGTERELLDQFESPFEVVTKPDLFEQELIEKFTRFANGQEVDFDDLEIDESWMTPFQQSVLQACRSIPCGETVSYGELAELAGAPKAARAVGSVMSHNRFPLIVPCHRVVSSGRRLGGFSAPTGTSLKIRLLQMEGAAGFCGLAETN